eukprot:TRINITY_DN4665_c0_g1_i1.p1 TRINITY_DN4665_c0_g1~~TRINITY_DN4665_c0_g1_i1.p1  ORF type:complete len:1229 (+),score=206.86 TRINITY_DN4665_c0_g1_i1:154-3840(+)
MMHYTDADGLEPMRSPVALPPVPPIQPFPTNTASNAPPAMPLPIPMAMPMPVPYVTNGVRNGRKASGRQNAADKHAAHHNTQGGALHCGICGMFLGPTSAPAPRPQQPSPNASAKIRFPDGGGPAVVTHSHCPWHPNPVKSRATLTGPGAPHNLPYPDILPVAVTDPVSGLATPWMSPAAGFLPPINGNGALANPPPPTDPAAAYWGQASPQHPPQGPLSPARANSYVSPRGGARPSNTQGLQEGNPNNASMRPRPRSLPLQDAMNVDRLVQSDRQAVEKDEEKQYKLMLRSFWVDAKDISDKEEDRRRSAEKWRKQVEREQELRVQRALEELEAEMLGKPKPKPKPEPAAQRAQPPLQPSPPPRPQKQAQPQPAPRQPIVIPRHPLAMPSTLLAGGTPPPMQAPVVPAPPPRQPAEMVSPPRKPPAAPKRASAEPPQISSAAKPPQQDPQPQIQVKYSDEEAATKIQSSWRGLQGRKEAKRRKQFLVVEELPKAESPEPSQTKLDEELAATMIQASWRGLQGRKEAKRRKHFAVTESPPQTAKQSSQLKTQDITGPKPKDEDQAATKIQASWRGRQGRKEAQRRKHFAVTESPPQTLTRKQPIDRQPDEEQAAVKIQASWRGAQGRKEASRRRHHTAIVEEAPKPSRVVEKLQIEEEKAATKIQASWRGLQGRKEANTRRKHQTAIVEDDEPPVAQEARPVKKAGNEPLNALVAGELVTSETLHRQAIEYDEMEALITAKVELRNLVRASVVQRRDQQVQRKSMQRSQGLPPGVEVAVLRFRFKSPQEDYYNPGQAAVVITYGNEQRNTTLQRTGPDGTIAWEEDSEGAVYRFPLPLDDTGNGPDSLDGTVVHFEVFADEQRETLMGKYTLALRQLYRDEAATLQLGLLLRQGDRWAEAPGSAELVVRVRLARCGPARPPRPFSGSQPRVPPKPAGPSPDLDTPLDPRQRAASTQQANSGTSPECLAPELLPADGKLPSGERAGLRVTVLKAEDLPQVGGGAPDALVRVRVSQTAHDTPVRSSRDPEWGRDLPEFPVWPTSVTAHFKVLDRDGTAAGEDVIGEAQLLLAELPHAAPARVWLDLLRRDATSGKWLLLPSKSRLLVQCTAVGFGIGQHFNSQVSVTVVCAEAVPSYTKLQVVLTVDSSATRETTPVPISAGPLWNERIALPAGEVLYVQLADRGRQVGATAVRLRHKSAEGLLWCPLHQRQDQKWVPLGARVLLQIERK